MNIVAKKLSRTVGLALAVAGITGLSLAGTASATTTSSIAAGTTCAFQTSDGHYVTAVGGGGRTTDVIHSNATRVDTWEKFFVDSIGNGQYVIETYNGYFVTAVGGGGRTTNAIYTNATSVGSWEKFRLVCGV